MAKNAKQKQPSDKFFLFQMADSNEQKLKRDEIKIIQYILFIFIFLLVMIDFVAVIFYVRTRNRQTFASNHNFTQAIQKNMLDSSISHDEYKVKNMEIIKSKQSFLREEIDQLIHMNQELKQPTIDMVNLNQLKQKLENFIKDSRENKLKNFAENEAGTNAVDRMKRDLDQTQMSFGHINKVLLEIRDFVAKSENAEHSINVGANSRKSCSRSTTT